MSRNTLVLSILLAVTAFVSWLDADTLVLRDGRKIGGEVSQTVDGYAVRTRQGEVIELRRDEVQQWIKGDAAPASNPQSLPVKGTQPATATAPATATVPATTPSSRRAGKSVETLVNQGLDALLGREYKTARDFFADALAIEPRNIKALHGMGLAMMYLNDFKSATSFMDRAIMFSAGKPERPLVLNYAMLQIANNNPMRAVKTIRDYIEPRLKLVDEPMLDALGSGLFLADYGARKNVLWTSSADFYLKYQKYIESTRPGMKRWGVEWLPVKEVEARMGELRKKELVANRIVQQLDDAEIDVIRAKRQLRNMQGQFARGMASNLEVNVAQVTLTDKLTEFHKLAKAYDEACDSIERPTWPRVLTPVFLDELTPPGADAPNLVMNDPVYKDAMAKASKGMGEAKRSTAEPEEDKGAVKPPAAPVTPPPAVVSIKSDKVKKVRVTQYAAAFAITPELIVTAAAPLSNAIEYELQDTVGASIQCEVIKLDEKSGLALLKLKDKKVPSLALGDTFPGGNMSCVTFPAVSLFNPTPELVAGFAGAPKNGAWTIKLARHPRLSGAPLVSGNKVIGVVMASRDNTIDNLPAVTLEALKALVGDLAGSAAPGAATKDPTNALFQLTAIREVSNE